MDDIYIKMSVADFDQIKWFLKKLEIKYSVVKDKLYNQPKAAKPAAEVLRYEDTTNERLIYLQDVVDSTPRNQVVQIGNSENERVVDLQNVNNNESISKLCDQKNQIEDEQEDRTDYIAQLADSLNQLSKDQRNT